MQITALLAELIADARAQNPDCPPLIGIAGAQGSGKTFQCRRFVAAHPRTAHFSLDDVYWPKSKRRDLARFSHPLFITRGPPGTHDLELAVRTIEALRAAPANAATPLPRFDKARDDRASEHEWPVFVGRPEAILFDGWCLGATPPPQGAPLNALEAADTDGAWRATLAQLLAGDYARFFTSFDAIAYLKPPNWEIVKSWRTEQEAENLGRPLTREDHARLDRFLQHYERITRSMMAGGHCAKCIVQLDEMRYVSRIEQHPNPATPAP